eukprot:4495690-Prymnesium_polylepis.1
MPAVCSRAGVSSLQRAPPPLPLCTRRTAGGTTERRRGSRPKFASWLSGAALAALSRARPQPVMPRLFVRVHHARSTIPLARTCGRRKAATPSQSEPRHPSGLVPQ